MSNEHTPETPINFTEMEKLDIQKMNIEIQNAFMKQHIEITAPAKSDLASMIRDEKQMYSNLGILFACHYHAAVQKRKTK